MAAYWGMEQQIVGTFSSLKNEVALFTLNSTLRNVWQQNESLACGDLFMSSSTYDKINMLFSSRAWCCKNI